MMRLAPILGFSAAFLATAAAGQDRSVSGALGQVSPACTVEPVRDRLDGVTPEGDLILASGAPARLSAIRLPHQSPYRDDALAWLRARTGQPLLVEGGAERDRWGRLSTRIRTDDDKGALDLARGLVESGLALVDPSTGDPFCQPELWALEETARQQNLGLWANDLYKPVDAEQISRLQDRVGTFTLVEGRVLSVGERKQRIYLNFGRHWAEDFTIIIPRRIWKIMTERGMDATALKGRRVRARGILEPWQGAALTVVVPEMIERLEGTRLPR